MAPRTTKHATTAHHIEMHKLMSTVLTVITPADPVTGAKALVVYKAGWDDARVARSVDPGLSPSSASTVRDQNFGKLRPAPANKDQLEALTTLVHELAVELHALKTVVEGRAVNGAPPRAM